MITGLFHVGFIVRDLERSIAWYHDNLGMEVAYRVSSTGEGFHKMTGLPQKPVEMCYMRCGSGYVELHCFPDNATAPSAPPMDHTNAVHLSLYSDDVETTYNELKAKGVDFVAPIIVAPTSGRKAVYFRDPDGNVLELVDPIPMK